MSDITPGDPAPDFSLPSQTGEDVSLEALRGKTVVLYFYPKDDTPGCTKQAMAFTENLAEFEAEGATVIGVSKDTTAKHAKFIDKHGLKLTLLSDADADVCERYGVWKEKNMYGRKYMGIERSTFLIGADGTLREIWRKVKVPGHAEAVLDAVRAL